MPLRTTNGCQCPARVRHRHAEAAAAPVGEPHSHPTGVSHHPQPTFPGTAVGQLRCPHPTLTAGVPGGCERHPAWSRAVPGPCTRLGSSACVQPLATGCLGVQPLLPPRQPQVPPRHQHQPLPWLSLQTGSHSRNSSVQLALGRPGVSYARVIPPAAVALPSTLPHHSWGCARSAAEPGSHSHHSSRAPAAGPSCIPRAAGSPLGDMQGAGSCWSMAEESRASTSLCR